MKLAFLMQQLLHYTKLRQKATGFKKNMYFCCYIVTILQQPVSFLQPRRFYRI